MPDRSRTRVLALVGLLVVFYLALDGFAAIEMGAYLLGRDDVENPVRYALLYLGAYSFGLLGWVALQAHASRAIRYTAHAITIVTGAAFLAFAQINSEGYGITEATRFWEEVEFIGDAIAFFAGTWVPPALLLATVLALFEWSLATRITGLRARGWIVVPLVAGGVFYGILKQSDARLEQFPVPYRVAVLTAYAFGHQVVWLGERDAPYFAARAEPLAPHIVFVVDESIRGDLLGSSGGTFETTPFLSSLSTTEGGLFDYGVASAIANLSSPANIILQSGLRPSELPDTDMRSMKNPNVFAYMKAAGFATYLIDAQHGMGRPPNFMTQADVDALDGHLLVRDRDDDFEQWDADRLILPALAHVIESNERSFSYVLKIGAHFPYSVRYPPDFVTFDASDVASELPDYDARRARIFTEYLNTLRWGVDEFSRELATTLAATGRDVVVIYTADHAQSLFESWGPDDRRIRGHGHSPNPPPHQARVPLFLMAIGDRPSAALAAVYDGSLRNRTSAFELFPTLLSLAGYADDDIRGRYHHTLFDRDADRSRRVFVSGNHFGADGPLYRDAPYRSSFGLNEIRE
jgi:hypothetical protein